MSAFGALRSMRTQIAFDAIAASSNKCIEGVPGLGFVICAQDRRWTKRKGNATTLVLDLHDQWAEFRQDRPIPLHAADPCDRRVPSGAEEFDAEGGVAGRGGRYAENCRVLIDGMRALGFEPLLPDHLQAPIIVTFRMPADQSFVFQRFYDRLKERGYVIYPGKLTVADCFRIGCIGRLYPEHMRGALAAIRDILDEMGVQFAEGREGGVRRTQA